MVRELCINQLEKQVSKKLGEGYERRRRMPAMA